MLQNKPSLSLRASTHLGSFWLKWMTSPVCQPQLSRRIPVAETGTDESVIWIISNGVIDLLSWILPTLPAHGNTSTAGTSHCFTTVGIIASPFSASQLAAGKANYAKYHNAQRSQFIYLCLLIKTLASWLDAQRHTIKSLIVKRCCQVSSHTRSSGFSAVSL